MENELFRMKPNYRLCTDERIIVKMKSFVGLQCSKSEGTKWLLNKRNPDWGWGTRGEAQSIIALHLTNDRLLNKSDPYVYISVKEMNIDLLKALSHDTELASSEWGHGVLGIYVTALIATCQDPHDFYGFDLLDKLQFHVENFTDYYKSNKFAYSWALIGICVAGGQIEDRYKDHLVTQFGNTSFNIDTISMILMALSCGRSDINNDTYIQNLASFIASKQLPSGAFGNEYTTALAVQALLSINDSRMTTVVDKALFNLTTTLVKEDPDDNLNTTHNRANIEYRRTSSKLEVGPGAQEEEASHVGYPHRPSMFMH
ncbi:hypothetical protein FSP39_024109 [Pinctada imbricata]|uniref:Uncharacterized protein n=1 Tax=Pinctada imbricata TaxID=66713 RepID=A0AA88XUM0_PINIB|nr:hypothetical protein FSP39_024109 [Pinctada imbricata]